MTSPEAVLMPVVLIITRTPLWVWGVFMLLAWLGGRQLRASKMSLRHVIVLPLAMTALSLFDTVSVFGGQLAVLSAWTLAAGGCAAGVLAIPVPITTRFDATSSTFRVPGSALPLVLMLGIFATKYALGVATAVFPLQVQSAAVALSCAALLGAFSGAFAARAVRLLRLRQVLMHQSPVHSASPAIAN